MGLRWLGGVLARGVLRVPKVGLNERTNGRKAKGDERNKKEEAGEERWWAIGRGREDSKESLGYLEDGKGKC